jgi:hypothetical protein
VRFKVKRESDIEREGVGGRQSLLGGRDTGKHTDTVKVKRGRDIERAGQSLCTGDRGNTDTERQTRVHTDTGGGGRVHTDTGERVHELTHLHDGKGTERWGVGEGCGGAGYLPAGKPKCNFGMKCYRQ